MTFLKISKTQKLPQNTLKPKLKKIKMSCKEASNKKVQKTSYKLNRKILRMTFSKFSKT